VAHTPHLSLVTVATRTLWRCQVRPSATVIAERKVEPSRSSRARSVPVRVNGGEWL
jgi:hypothetical protein